MLAFKSAFSFCMLTVLVLFASAWGKVVDLEDKEEHGESLTNGVANVETLTHPGANDPCLYRGKIFTIDVRKIANKIKGVNITSPDSKYIYFLSLCSPTPCTFSPNPEPGNYTSTGCQYIFKQDHFVVLGRNRFDWHIVNTTYFYIMLYDGDVDEVGNARRFQVGFKVDNACNVKKPTVTFNGETNSAQDQGITYLFTINIKMHEEEYLSLNENIEI